MKRRLSDCDGYDHPQMSSVVFALLLLPFIWGIYLQGMMGHVHMLPCPNVYSKSAKRIALIGR